MVDGFHWTRVTAKQLRFLYEAVTLTPAPPHMRELATRIDQRQNGMSATSADAAVRNPSLYVRVENTKEHPE